MYTPVFWIKTDTPGKLGFMARPRGGEWLTDELHALAMREVGMLVSVLSPSERSQYGLEGLADGCTAHALELYRFPLPQRGTPADEEALQALCTHVREALIAGTDVVLQGGRGQGRAPMLAAIILQDIGYGFLDTQTRLRKAARGLVVPKHPNQQKWLRERYMAETSLIQDQ